MTITIDNPTEISEKYYVSDIPRLDPDHKAFWIEQLESEKYAGKQGKGALQDPDGNFCCLGVYCDAKEFPFVLKEQWWTRDSQNRLVDMKLYGDDVDRSSGSLPQNFQIPLTGPYPAMSCSPPKWTFSGEETVFAMVRPIDEKLILDGQLSPNHRTGISVIVLNDTDGLTFSQIADVIRYFL